MVFLSIRQPGFEAICDERQKWLSAAADTQSVEEHDVDVAKANTLLQMADQFLNDGKRITVQRFSRLWGQCRSWMGFTREPTDAGLRDAELSVIKHIVSAAAPQTAIAIFEALSPQYSHPDISEGAYKSQEAATELGRIVANHALDAAENSLRTEGGVRRLAEPKRFQSIVKLLFDPSSMLWAERRSELLALIRSGHEDSVVYENVREFLLLLEDAFELRSQIILFDWAKSLAKDEEIVEAIWEIATSRPIQYRMQVAYVRARRFLIHNGANETMLPLNEEL